MKKMKKLNLLFAIFSIAVLGFLSSCETDPTEDLSPLLTITTSGLSGTNTIMEGSTYDVDITAAQNPTSTKKLKELVVQTPGADTTVVIGAASYSNTFTFDAPLAGVTHTYTFILKDNDNVTITKTLTVTGTGVVVVSTPFGAEVVGAFFHIEGSLQGAYNLVDEATVAVAGTETFKDMKNMNIAGANFTGSWTTGTGNGTLYVRANSFDYANGSVEDAMAAYAGGNAGGTMLNPLSGNVFIAKLRGGSNYAIIKIVTIDPNNNDCACGNKGKITFNFKKS
jgi:hypothetical protein